MKITNSWVHVSIISVNWAKYRWKFFEGQEISFQCELCIWYKNMQATVKSSLDASNKRIAVIHTAPNTTITFCDFSQNESGFSCFHGAEVICEKYENANKFQYVEWFLTEEWRSQYEGVSFYIKTQDDIEVMNNARLIVESVERLSVTVHLETNILSCHYGTT